MKKYYGFAGVDFEIDIPDEMIYSDERNLSAFAAENVTDPERCVFSLVDELTPPGGVCIANEGGFRVYAEGADTVRYIGSVRQSWEEAYARVLHRGREHFAQIKRSEHTRRLGVHTVLGCLAAEHLVTRASGVILHSSFVGTRGRAILFTAPSETGKSTQADLWQKLRGAEIINGDRAAVRALNTGVFACGIPFSGSSKFCENQTLPLAAIVYLKQAPQTTIRRLRGAEAFRRVWEGCSVNVWDRTDVDLASKTVQRIVTEVSVYELACTPDESAVIALEGVLVE